MCLWCASRRPGPQRPEAAPMRRRFSAPGVVNYSQDPGPSDSSRRRKRECAAVTRTASAGSQMSWTLIDCEVDNIPTEESKPPQAKKRRRSRRPHKPKPIITPPPYQTSILITQSTLQPSETSSVQSRPLRRKRRMSTLRRESESSTSLRRHTVAPTIKSAPDENLIELRSFSPPPPPSPTHSTPAPTVRVGHPSRPYYTAIRRHMYTPMSAPSTPMGNSYPASIASSYAPSLPCSLPLPLRHAHHDMPRRFSTALDTDPGRPSLRQAVSTPHGYSGFSLSGETELRMNLARRTSQSDFRFKFHETGKSGGVKGRIQSFGKGILDILNVGGRCKIP
ncbi:hypothetical protein JAAARDRAFT_289001 [Jaapia argillacea MUCL 33604]|uniref:Uncharacterized protein n=1 Tax=Jaapia argillacea MUCL 33604 TaxID=933084 RepID=A0A067PQY4_9AGAM|nr:hypothetical protein JAAARDRAFT_289001 [Jaapia argillacea MUCL 33604]